MKSNVIIFNIFGSNLTTRYLINHLLVEYKNEFIKIIQKKFRFSRIESTEILFLVLRKHIEPI